MTSIIFCILLFAKISMTSPLSVSRLVSKLSEFITIRVKIRISVISKRDNVINNKQDDCIRKKGCHSEMTHTIQTVTSNKWKLLWQWLATVILVSIKQGSDWLCVTIGGIASWIHSATATFQSLWYTKSKMFKENGDKSNFWLQTLLLAIHLWVNL